MGTIKQRKRFDHAEPAIQTRAWFLHPMFRIPGIAVDAQVIETEGQIWLYVMHSGDIIDSDDDSAILPDYERVA